MSIIDSSPADIQKVTFYLSQNGSFLYSTGASCKQMITV